MGEPVVGLMQAAWNERGPEYRTQRHQSPLWQLYGVVYGRVRMRLERQVHDLHPDQVLLIRPGSWRSPRAARPQAQGYFWAVFGSGHDWEDLPGRILPLPRHLLGCRDEIITAIRQQGRHPEDRPLLTCLIGHLLLGLQRHLRVRHGQTTATPLNLVAADHPVDMAATFIAAHLAEPLPRERVAAAVYCSVSHLGRLFRLQRGHGITEEVIAQRLACARRLLLESEDSITRIAVAAGYGNYSHFSQLFRQRVGVSPSAYRCARGLVYRGR